jgi:hypothetical protein
MSSQACIHQFSLRSCSTVMTWSSHLMWFWCSACVIKFVCTTLCFSVMYSVYGTLEYSTAVSAAHLNRSTASSLKLPLLCYAMLWFTYMINDTTAVWQQQGSACRLQTAVRCLGSECTTVTFYNWILQLLSFCYIPILFNPRLSIDNIVVVSACARCCDASGHERRVWLRYK